MLVLEIFFEGRQVGICYDVRLDMERGDPIDITTKDSPFPEFIPGLPSWTIEAHDVIWHEDTDPSHYATSSAPLLLCVEEDERPIMEGHAYIQGIRTESSPTTRLVYHVDFIGQGMLVRTDGLRPIMDRTELDSAPWNIHDNIIIGDDPATAVGFALSASEDVRKQKAMHEQLKRDIKGLGQIIYTPNDSIAFTPEIRTKKRTKESDREDSDEPPRGFRIVP